MIAVTRANSVLRMAKAAGFEQAGIAPAGPVTRADYLRAWLDAGVAGEMAYLARWRDLREDPRRLVPGARSVVVVAHVYGQGGQGGGGEGGSGRGGRAETRGAGDERKSRRSEESGCDEDVRSTIQSPKPRVAKVARYAWGRDYHRVIRKKLHAVVDELRRTISEPFEARVCVDTAPLLEREWAAAAGVGWIGKNTLVLHPALGSFFFLGAIVTTLDLSPTLPLADHCGTCTRCLDACPTQAFTAPYQMDARRCISYLTIEHRSDIAPALAPSIGDWLYGCDICQDVCPHNAKAPATREPAYHIGANPLVPAVAPERILAMNEADYAAATAGSAMKRASLAMLKRNARIVS